MVGDPSHPHYEQSYAPLFTPSTEGIGFNCGEHSATLFGETGRGGVALLITLRHTRAMPSVRIPHSLPAAEVRRRMEARVGDLHKLLPGGMGRIESAWEGQDRLAITVRVMGQVIESAAVVERGALVIEYALPKGASFIAPMVEAVIRRAGDKLLLG
jgi:hypothetical protein